MTAVPCLALHTILCSIISKFIYIYKVWTWKAPQGLRTPLNREMSSKMLLHIMPQQHPKAKNWATRVSLTGLGIYRSQKHRSGAAPGVTQTCTRQTFWLPRRLHPSEKSCKKIRMISRGTDFIRPSSSQVHMITCTGRRWKRLITDPLIYDKTKSEYPLRKVI